MLTHFVRDLFTSPVGAMAIIPGDNVGQGRVAMQV